MKTENEPSDVDVLRCIMQWMGEFERVDREQKKPMLEQLNKRMAEDFTATYYNIELPEMIELMEEIALEYNVPCTCRLVGE